MDPCRKCGEPNPETNQYCQKCGAVLHVSTRMVQAQPKAIHPIIHKFSKRWLLIGLFTMLGAATFAALIAFVLLIFVFSIKIGSANGGLLNTGAVGVFILVALVFLCAFGIGGFLITWISKKVRVLEPALSALIVVLIVGVLGRSISTDALIGALLLSVPSAVFAGLGGWIGGFSTKGIS